MIQVAMTPAQFEAAGLKLKQQYGLLLQGSKGTLSKSGVTASYAYDGASLEVSILKKPLLFSINFCEAQLVKWLDLAAPSVN